MAERTLLVEDDLEYAQYLTTVLGGMLRFTHRCSVDEAIQELELNSFDLIICDYRLFDTTSEPVIQHARKSTLNKYTPILVLSSVDEVGTVVRLFELGVDDFVSKGCDVMELAARIVSAKRIRDLYFFADKTALENQELKKQVGQKIVGDSPEFTSQVELALKVAATDATILLTGETGVGKEVVARLVHESSGRKGHFVPINVAAIPKELLESELFGHEKGAFSGAGFARKGLIESAHQGTLFLDEIAELPLELQPKLLRVLQDRKVRRIGSNIEIPVDFRLVSATCKDLKKLVELGQFRQDLFYRLNLIQVEIPPLRARRGDIIKLANHFLDLAQIRFNRGRKSFSREALELLITYDWPGNVRELENVVYRAYLVTDSASISSSDLEFLLQGQHRPAGSQTITTAVLQDDSLDLETKIQLLEKAVYQEAMERAKGNKSKAARLVGVSRVTFLQKLRKYQLER